MHTPHTRTHARTHLLTSTPVVPSVYVPTAVALASNHDVNPLTRPPTHGGGGRGEGGVVAVVEGGGGDGDGVCAVTSGHNNRTSQDLSRVRDKGVEQHTTTEETSLVWWLG